jgi:hypothetical protein
VERTTSKELGPNFWSIRPAVVFGNTQKRIRVCGVLEDDIAELALETVSSKDSPGMGLDVR